MGSHHFERPNSHQTLWLEQTLESGWWWYFICNCLVETEALFFRLPPRPPTLTLSLLHTDSKCNTTRSMLGQLLHLSWSDCNTPGILSFFFSLKKKGSNLNFRHIPFRNRKMLTVFQLSSNWIPESAVVRVIIIQKRGWGFSYHTNVLKMVFWAHHIPCWIIVINLTHWLRSVCSFSEARLCRDMKSFLNFHSREEYKKEERWGHILSPAVLKSTQLRVLNPQSGTICKEGQVI